MITSLSVGATFSIRDEATAVLTRLAEQVERLDALTKSTINNLRMLGEERFSGLSRSLGNVERRMTAIGTASERMSTAFVTSTEAMVAGLAVATEQIGAMAVEMRSVAAATRMVAVPGAGGAGRGAGRGGDGGHGGPLRARVPIGPMHAHTGLSAGMGAAALGGFGLFEGYKQAGSEQLSLTAAVLAGGMDPRSPQGQALHNQLQEIVFGARQGTRYDPATVAKAMPGIMGFAARDPQHTMPLIMPALRFGEAEQWTGQAIGKTWGIEASAEALIQTSHLLRTMDPDKMAPIANMMMTISQTTGKSPESLTKILQYTAGTAQAVGFSPMETTELAGLASIFFPGTRAGTNMNMMMQGLLKGGGPGAGTNIARHQKARERNPLWKALVDPHTGTLYRDASGQMLAPFLEHMAAFAYTHPGKETQADFVQLFGTRGGRMYDLAQQGTLQSYAELARRQEAQLGPITTQQILTDNTLSGQSAMAWASVKSVLNEIVSPTLPAVISGFKGLNLALFNTETFFHKNPTAGKAVTTATAVGGALTIDALMARYLGVGVVSAIGVPAALAVGAVAAPYLATSLLSDETKKYFGIGPETGRGPARQALGVSDSPIGPRTVSPWSPQVPGAAPNVNVSVTVNGAFLSDIVAKVLAALAPALHNSLMHNSGPAAGANESPFTAGGPGYVFP